MNKRALIQSIVFSLMVGGCAVNETASVSTENGELTQQYLESNSGFLSASLNIGEVNVTEIGELVKAQVTLVNGSRSELSFRYKFKWLDSAGFEVALEGRPWTPMTITPYEQKNVQAVAPNATAKSFKILVQD